MRLYCYDYADFCFFFQAEDGIRDDLVTGVQTCALPISTDNSPALLNKIAKPLTPPETIENGVKNIPVPKETINVPSKTTNNSKIECKILFLSNFFLKNTLFMFFCLHF